MYSDKENINILTALLVRYGISHAVVCPGSRNAAIVHNLHECPSIQCHPVTDERSAAFVAMGIAQQTESIVAVCVTSGSALLNLMPGIAEATYQHCGIIAITADRPLSWIGQLDGQTMPQQGAMGTFVERSVSLPECHDDSDRWHCRRLICDAINALIITGRSVHINVPLSEPLFSFTVERLPEVSAITVLDWRDEASRDAVHDIIGRARRPMVVVGQTDLSTAKAVAVAAEHCDAVVTLAEQLGSTSPSPSLDDAIASAGDAISDYAPDVLIYAGGNTISKRLRLFLRTLTDCTVIMVNAHGQTEDVTQHATHVVMGPTDRVVADIFRFAHDANADESFRQRWNDLLASTLTSSTTPAPDIEAEAVRMLESIIPADITVYYANSTSVRLAARYARHHVRCNRGLNGIEGSLSAAVGASLVAEGRVCCVIGDLSFFYDGNALWNEHLRGNLRILLLNNGEGAIFRRLQGLDASPARHDLVMGAHHTTAEGTCRQHGIVYRAADTAEGLQKDVAWLVTADADRPLLLEVMAHPKQCR